MSVSHIFISHSHRDDNFTMQFVRDLRGAGIEVWVDVADLNDGNFMQRINEALNQCEWLVLVQTPDALRSPAVRTEVDAAINLAWRGKMRGVIPFIARSCDPNEVPPTWAVLHYYDATHGYATALNGLVQAISANTQLPSAQPLTPPPVLSSPPVEPLPLPGIPNTDIVPESLHKLGYEGRTINGTSVIFPPLCYVPAGPFWMGSDLATDKKAREDEQPQSEINLLAFEIGEYPVTVVEFACYLNAIEIDPRYTRNPASHDIIRRDADTWVWAKGSGYQDGAAWNAQANNLEYPVAGIRWLTAYDYTRWLRRLTGQTWSLPTEAKWEKAARGADKRLYPWGNQWDETRANTIEGGPGEITPINLYGNNVSPYGVRGMAGNVWEWCSSRFAGYPYSDDDGRENPTEGNYVGSLSRVVRGGSYSSNAVQARTAGRASMSAGLVSQPLDSLDSSMTAVGFRLVRSVPQ